MSSIDKFFLIFKTLSSFMRASQQHFRLQVGSWQTDLTTTTPATSSFSSVIWKRCFHPDKKILEIKIILLIFLPFDFKNDVDFLLMNLKNVNYRVSCFLLGVLRRVDLSTGKSFSVYTKSHRQLNFTNRAFLKIPVLQYHYSRKSNKKKTIFHMDPDREWNLLFKK